ncbi:MAG: hypothetical protein ACRDUY_08090 [Nitriliruptorales bacterium]
MNWQAWDLDLVTWLWLAWIAAFVALEAYGVARAEALTDHIRPLVRSGSLPWFLTSGFIAWLGYHFLIEA